MNATQSLLYLVEYWELIKEDDDAINSELDSADDVQSLAIEYCQMVMDDADYWLQRDEQGWNFFLLRTRDLAKELGINQQEWAA